MATGGGRTTETRRGAAQSGRPGACETPRYALERRAESQLSRAQARRRDFRRPGIFFPVVGCGRPLPDRAPRPAIPAIPAIPATPRDPPRLPAAAMKKFFQEIKADIKFKSAGPGQKLAESVSCRVEAGGGFGGSSAAGSDLKKGCAGDRGVRRSVGVRRAGVRGVVYTKGAWFLGGGRGLGKLGGGWSARGTPARQGLR